MNEVSIWGYSIPASGLTKDELDYLMRLPQELPPIEWVWGEIDRIWRFHKLGNPRPLADQAIREFYSHPVWLMNGIFSAVDPVSSAHREAIAGYLGRGEVRSVADYGGGFGELARAIIRTIPSARVSIIEPYQSRVALEMFKKEPRIQLIPSLCSAHYDAVVAQDVLEHVETPILLAGEIAEGARQGGMVIFANCFYPFIQCHLPSTFHLRHTFCLVMSALGLRFIGSVSGTGNALAFIRSGPINLSRAQLAERASRLFGPGFNRLRQIMKTIKRTKGLK